MRYVSKPVTIEAVHVPVDVDENPEAVSALDAELNSLSAHLRFIRGPTRYPMCVHIFPAGRQNFRPFVVWVGDYLVVSEGRVFSMGRVEFEATYALDAERVAA